jgi:hypothetical protein
MLVLVGMRTAGEYYRCMDGWMIYKLGGWTRGGGLSFAFFSLSLSFSLSVFVG